MILSLLLYLYEAVLKKYKFHAYFYTSALIFYFTKKADKMQVLFIKKSNNKKFYNKCERFLRPYRTYFFMAFAYNEDRATQRCDSSAL